jgi:predicted transcriptional regulator
MPRKKPFRPKRPPQGVFHVKMSDEVRAALDGLASRRNQTAADVVRALILREAAT